MRVSLQFPMIHQNREKFARLAISATVVALVYWTGRLSAPSALIFGYGRSAWMTISYTLMGIFFLIYAASNAAIRWTIILIGAAFGYVAGLVGQQIEMMMPVRTFFVDAYPSSQWESIASILVFDPWLGGALAGAIILILHRGFVILKRWRT